MQVQYIVNSAIFNLKLEGLFINNITSLNNYMFSNLIDNWFNFLFLSSYNVVFYYKNIQEFINLYLSNSEVTYVSVIYKSFTLDLNILLKLIFPEILNILEDASNIKYLEDFSIFYAYFYKQHVFPYTTFNRVSLKLGSIEFFYDYNLILDYLYTYILLNQYYLIVFLFFLIPLLGKKYLNNFLTFYINSLILIPTLIETSLEDFLILLSFFKILFLYFLVSLFFLTKPNYFQNSYFSLISIFLIFGSVLILTFIKFLVLLFTFGPSTYTGINFSKFNQSILFSLTWDYVIIVMMLFRFGVVLARLILTWMSFVLVEVIAYFFMEPLNDELFIKLNFLWNNAQSLNNHLVTLYNYNNYGESYILFFITCFFYFCKLLLVSLQLFLFLFFGFFLITMFTGYMNLTKFTSYFFNQYLKNSRV